MEFNVNGNVRTNGIRLNNPVNSSSMVNDDEDNLFDFTGNDKKVGNMLPDEYETKGWFSNLWSKIRKIAKPILSIIPYGDKIGSWLDKISDWDEQRTADDNINWEYA